MCVCVCVYVGKSSFCLQVYNRRTVADHFVGQASAGVGATKDSTGTMHTLPLMDRGRHANDATEGTVTLTVYHYKSLRAV